jgi:histone H3/H4
MLPIAAMQRILRKNGVDRISKQALKELEKTVVELGLELAMEAATLARHAHRRTIKKEDIMIVAGKE